MHGHADHDFLFRSTNRCGPRATTSRATSAGFKSGPWEDLYRVKRPRRRECCFRQNRPQLFPGGRPRRRHPGVNPKITRQYGSRPEGTTSLVATIDHHRRVSTWAAKGPNMRNPIVVEDIEGMRRRQGIDDVELREEIR